VGWSTPTSGRVVNEKGTGTPRAEGARIEGPEGGCIKRTGTAFLFNSLHLTLRSLYSALNTVIFVYF